MLFFIKRACTVAPQVEKAWPRPIAKALLARVPRIGAHKASFPRPITCGAGFSLWRCRVERAVRSHSLRAWAIGRAQMAIPSKECTLLRTIYNTKCPCAGSLALKALIEAEVSYTLTSFASSRGHESPGYPDRQRPLCLAAVILACLAVVVCLRPNRGLTVVLLGRSSTTATGEPGTLVPLKVVTVH